MWPVYVPIGNIVSLTQHSPTKMLIRLLALLSVQPKLSHKSVSADQIQRQMNADALQAVFDLILALLQEITNNNTVIDCADVKRRLYFPILSAWIADHAKHTILNRISSKSCQQSVVPATELGKDPRKIFEPCKHVHYAQKTWEYEHTQYTHIGDYFQQNWDANRPQRILRTLLSKSC